MLSYLPTASECHQSPAAKELCQIIEAGGRARAASRRTWFLLRRVKGALVVPPDFRNVIGSVKAFFQRLALDPPGGLPPGLPPANAAPQPAAEPTGVPESEEPPAQEARKRDGPKATAKPGTPLFSWYSRLCSPEPPAALPSLPTYL